MIGYLQFLGLLSLTIFVGASLAVWGYVCIYWVCELRGHTARLLKRLSIDK